MDLIQMTRELGAAIQKDERYLAFAKARQENEEDTELMGIMGQLQMLQMNFQREQEKEEASEEKLEKINEEFEAVYAKFMANDKMQAYEAARAEIDSLMNYIMQILGLCVNGSDPMICEPEEHNCDGSCDCGECGGDCSDGCSCH